MESNIMGAPGMLPVYCDAKTWAAASRNSQRREARINRSLCLFRGFRPTANRRAT